MKTTIKLSLAGLALALTTGVACADTAANNWDNNCASCHGADGKGQTKMGKKLKVQDYTDAKAQAGMKDEDMVKAVTDGVKADGKERMKSFKDDLSADEIKDLVAYVRKFKG